MKEMMLGVSILSALVLAPVGVNVQEIQSVAPAVPATVYEEYIPNYDENNEYEEYTEEETTPLFRTTARLNLRRGPGTHYGLIVTTNPGQLVYVTDTRDGTWFAVEVNGQTGYMFAEFLTEVVDIDLIISEVNGTVERLHWNEARNLTTRGTPLTIIDVRTGITWQVASFSNGNHADVEPITAADTAAMLQAFGRWCWQPRPVHVIVGGRTIAASINGMPHAGSTNRNNNMNGHVCLHFYGSRTHNGNRSHERDHQNAVNEAFRTVR